MMGHRQTRIRYLRLCNYRNRVFWCLVISLIAYNEWIVYWSVGARDFDTDKEAIRILVVADPQILGERYEPPYTRFFTHWDGDKYLQQGFKRAVAVSKPHIVVYLGDLADEGSIANEDEYSRYRQRFADIFRISPNTKEIFLPGDNDIGGEGYDRITENKTERFARYFQRAAVVSHSLIDIIPVNRLIAWQAEYLPYKMSERRIRILASHIPVLPIYGQFAADAVKRYQPHLILSAHTHEANCFHVQLEPTYKITVDNLSPDAPPLKAIILPDIENNPVESLTEFAVPTCSYRMGVRSMGYGVVQIDERKRTAKIAVLWLPERFPALRLYLLVVFICFLFALCKCCFYLWSGRVFKLVNAAKV